MKNTHIASQLSTLLIIALLSSMMFQLAFQSVAAAETDNQFPETRFSVIWITDTQYLTEDHPTYFDSMCRWIVNNAETYNVKMVVHTGDIVNSEGNQTQWVSANKSMSILLDDGIPYCWNAGNHDYNDTVWLGNQYTAFNPAVMEQKPYWLGDDSDGKSTAVHFTVGGQDFLIVNLAYSASDEAITWTNNLLDSHPESHAIVAAHFYLNRTGGYEEWATNLKHAVLATHSNVFLTLSAHVYSSVFQGIQTQVGDRHELVFNRQDKDSEMGAACVRILAFDTEQGTIDVKTFYLYANMFLTDSNNQFTLHTNFRNDLASDEEIPELPAVLVVVFPLVLLGVALVYSKPSLRHRKLSK